MSVMQFLDPLAAAAAHTCRNHGGLYALHDGGDWHDHSADDDVFYSNAIVAVGLPAVESEPVNALSEVLYPGESACINVRHYDRFCEIDAHFRLTPVFLSLSLQERSKHNRGGQSTHISRSVSKYYHTVTQFTIASSDGEQTVNPATKDTPHSATVTS